MFWRNALIVGEIVKMVAKSMFAQVNQCAREVCLKMRGNKIAELRAAVRKGSVYTCCELGSLRGARKFWNSVGRRVESGGRKIKDYKKNEKRNVHEVYICRL